MDLNASGMIDLRHIRTISKVEMAGSFTFCIMTDDRNLILRASTHTEMMGWIRAFHIHADIARGGSGRETILIYIYIYYCCLHIYIYAIYNIYIRNDNC